MKSYTRNFVNKALKREANRHIESRDAIIWQFSDIPEDSKVYCKIQGTNELVVAHFPRNMREKPAWLRVGNAVRIGHRGGVRGYITLLGEGRAIPQPVVGGALPPIGVQNDGIINGMVASATSPVSDGVLISDGSYRIDGTVYYYTGEESGFIVMDDPAPMVMGEIPIYDMGLSTFSFDIYPAPALNYFRYDIIVIDTGGNTSVVSGVETTGVPVMPTTPNNTVLIAFILRVGGDVGIPMNRINILYTPRYPTYVDITANPEIMAWGQDESTISFTLRDQYDRAFSAPSSTGWEAVLQKMGYTSGWLWSEDSGYDANEVSQVYTGSGYSFKYKRQQDATVETPPVLMLEIKCEPSPIFGSFTGITLEWEIV